ncbi:MAG: hypothetical protein Q4P20_00080 [Eubacteriales bacterium]|nr:hypothetical protein [Eubacteriales bacterium]
MNNNQTMQAEYLREAIKTLVDRMDDVDELTEVLDMLGYYGG